MAKFDLKWLNDLKLDYVPSEWGSWELLEDFCVLYRPEGSKQSFYIGAPAGLVTDFASIPRLGQAFYRRDADWILRASVIHDWLYTLNDLRAAYPEEWRSAGGGGTGTRKFADRFLRDGCRALGANAVRAWIVYQAVRAGGGSLWQRIPAARLADQKERFVEYGSWPSGGD